MHKMGLCHHVRLDLGMNSFHELKSQIRYKLFDFLILMVFSDVFLKEK